MMVPAKRLTAASGVHIEGTLVFPVKYRTAIRHPKSGDCIFPKQKE
jgi:hypothetical protein